MKRWIEFVLALGTLLVSLGAFFYGGYAGVVRGQYAEGAFWLALSLIAGRTADYCRDDLKKSVEDQPE